ncbi:MAG: SpoIIE family protein phosphatase [Spirochaetales bacterium]|nr:SpoIIE family protein phosphatase [Spirochaetales bacterium]
MTICRRFGFFITAVVLLLISGFFASVRVWAQDFYWEDEEVLVSSGTDFSRSASGGGLMASVWQEETFANAAGGTFYLSMTSSSGGGKWIVNNRFLGPFKYTGKESYFYSFIIDNAGKIILSVAEDDKTIGIYESGDGGGTFSRIYRSSAFPLRVSPRLSLRDDGGLLLFVTQESALNNFGSLGIYYSASDNGSTWTEYKALAPEAELKGNFLPSHTSYQGRDYVVFQAFYIGATSTFQLYLKHSDDGGISWSDPVYLSGFEDRNEYFAGDSYVFDNQRPFVLGTASGLSLVWERGYAGGNPQIYYADIGWDGQIVGVPEQVSRGSAECRNPRLSTYRGVDYLIWFDNRVGDYHNVIASRDGLYWSDYDLNNVTPGKSIFGNLLVSGGDMYVMWENEYRNKKRLMLLSPDKTVASPIIRAADFRAGYPAKQNSFTVRWNSPDDSSGIAGYSYTYGRDPSARPEEKLLMLDRQRSFSMDFDEDGLWYFQLIAQDYAGNWSEPAVIEMNRDTTPPGKISFIEPETDEDGTLLSNTSSLEWSPPEDGDLSGYSYRMQYMARWTYGGDQQALRPQLPSNSVQTTSEKYSFRNLDNGLWAFSVRTIDLVGNVGEAETYYFRINKYIPVTFITAVDSNRDDLGNVTLEISGRGFSVGGNIDQVILDRDGLEPYDYIYRQGDELYEVETDRFISGPVLEDIDTGTYKIGLIHPRRGLYFTRSGIDIESSGTVKFGDFSVVPQPLWSVVPERRINVPFEYILIALIMVLLLFLFIFTLQRTASLVSEARVLRHHAMVLIEGGIIGAEEKKKRVAQMSKIRMGLRIKFVLMFTFLVLLIVGMISVPITIFTSENQRDILASGLEDRAEVLLESITSGARTFLPSENILELNTLPSQMSALGDDAVFVTITSAGNSAAPNYDPDVYDYVWATNDPGLPEEAGRTTAFYKMDDEIAGIADELGAMINERAKAKVGFIVEEIRRLNEQVEPLVARFIRTGDTEAEDAINQIQDELRNLDQELNLRLYEIGNQVASYPPYVSEELTAAVTNFTFYKPVVFRTPGADSYFRGIVRLGISTSGILQIITESRQQLIKIISAIAAAAMIIGIIGALILAAIIIRPINLLVKGVELIRDTENKGDLKNHIIKVGTRDELSLLATTVNQMTEGLVKAAAANEMLTVGKEVQKKFIPLNEDSSGAKLSTGKDENDDIAFFGYYEGAKGVSGDYFDFRKIDDVHWAAIKCDVAGKGVPASLIMVEVATIFLSFFRNRKAVKNKSGKSLPPNIAELTYSINDLVEEVGFTGRFAAFTIVIINEVTGELYLCNAGDNIVHLYDSGQKAMITKILPESPASGVFPSEMVKMGTGFVQVKDQLKKGDSLLMFTDGLEEAQRHLRDSSFNIIKPDASEIADKNLPVTVSSNDGFEEFGTWRIQAMINTLKEGGKYHLEKYYNPMNDEELIFDFTDCVGSIEEIVMASVSVERVFRLYRTPSSGPDDRVLIDKPIAAFLKDHFDGWSEYFSHPLPARAEDQYITFTHLQEDEQFDDLTILGISKK